MNFKRDGILFWILINHTAVSKKNLVKIFPGGTVGHNGQFWPRPLFVDMWLNLNFKNQATVLKFKIMDAIDTRRKLKKIFLGHKSWRPFWILGPKLKFFILEIQKKQTIDFKYNIMSDIDLKNDQLLWKHFLDHK